MNFLCMKGWSPKQSVADEIAGCIRDGVEADPKEEVKRQRHYIPILAWIKEQGLTCTV